MLHLCHVLSQVLTRHAAPEVAPSTPRTHLHRMPNDNNRRYIVGIDEPITVTKVAGIAACLVGMWLINR